jgi:hypothetical protein
VHRPPFRPLAVHRDRHIQVVAVGTGLLPRTRRSLSEGSHGSAAVRAGALCRESPLGTVSR